MTIAEFVLASTTSLVPSVTSARPKGKPETVALKYHAVRPATLMTMIPFFSSS